MLRLANGVIEVELDPDRGSDILSIRHPGGANALATADWSSPLRASRSASYGDPVNDWLSEYRGGWQELFPNAGAPCTVMGVPLPFHGEVSTARWEVVEQAPDAVTLRTPARLPLILERRMRLDATRAVLRIEESVRADADARVPFLWGHHPAFAATDGARIVLPEGVVVNVDEAYEAPHGDLALGGVGTWPEAPGRQAGDAVALDRIGPGPTERLAFLSGFGERTWAAIRGIAPGLGVAMAWDARTFPGAWFWWEIGGPGHPWHGRSRIVAIEPSTDNPADGLAAAMERGTAHQVGPGDVHETWITVSLFDADDRPVRDVARDGSVAR